MTAPSEADAAGMRRAFNRAAETFPTSVVAHLRRNEKHDKPHQREPGVVAAERLMAWWSEMYRAITSHEAGLAVLAELQTLREEVARLAQKAQGRVA